MGKKSAKSGSSLGRAVINARENLPAAKRKRNKLRPGEDDVNGVVVSETCDKSQQMQSITEQNDLDEFLTKAQLAGTEFTAQRANLSLVDVEPNKLIGSVANSAAQGRKKLADCQEKYRDLLKIPRRPAWEKSMSAEQLQKAETEAFLIWRRQLAELEENEQVVLTPFERNIEIWRQLWRVVERSDVIVQILDARDPLLFRNGDLESYAKEVDASKINVLLLNKADFLTQRQRELWCRYFNEQNLRVVFWSAIDLLDDNDALRKVDGLSIGGDEEDEQVESDESTVSDEEYVNSTTSSDSDNCLCDEDVAADKQHVDDTRTELNDPRLMTKEGLIRYFEKLRNVVGLGEEDLLTIGMVGYPNVGKSSTINKLMCRKKVAVSATPGKTKHFQTLYLAPNLLLCDCPGLVMPSLAMNKAQMLLCGILAADQMRQYEPVVELLCSLLPRFVLERAYGLTFPTSHLDAAAGPNVAAKPVDLVTLYAFVRGFMSPKGLPDCSRAARAIVKDFVNGKLRFRNAPPTCNQSSFDSFVDWLKPVRTNQSERASNSTIQSPSSNFFADQSTSAATSFDWSEKREKAAVVSEALLTAQRRHLLADNEDSLSHEVDGSFFGQKISRVHIQTSKGQASLQQSGAVKPPKKSNKNQKKDKLRRIYKHLDA